MFFFFLMFLKVKFVTHPFWIMLVCAYLLGQSETTLLLLCNIPPKSVPQPDVFLLPMQSVRALTSLMKIVFCLLTLVNLLKYFFSCIFVLSSLNCVIVFFILVLACNWLISYCEAC
jgi:hypothetical protein